MGLFTLKNCCVSCSLDFYKLKLDFKSRLSIYEFSGYYCGIWKLKFVAKTEFLYLCRNSKNLDYAYKG